MHLSTEILELRFVGKRRHGAKPALNKWPHFTLEYSAQETQNQFEFEVSEVYFHIRDYILELKRISHIKPKLYYAERSCAELGLPVVSHGVSTL